MFKKAQFVKLKRLTILAHEWLVHNIGPNRKNNVDTMWISVVGITHFFAHDRSSSLVIPKGYEWRRTKPVGMPTVRFGIQIFATTEIWLQASAVILLWWVHWPHTFLMELIFIFTVNYTLLCVTISDWEFLLQMQHCISLYRPNLLTLLLFSWCASSFGILHLLMYCSHWLRELLKWDFDPKRYRYI